MAKRGNIRQKLPVNAPSTGLYNPFADIAVPGLPAGGPSQAGSSMGSQGQIEVPGGGEHNEAKHRAVLRRETAHRGGRAVVIVGAIEPPLSRERLESLASELRKACGSGGTVRGSEIEIQGEQVPRVREYLEQRGFRVGGVR